MINFLLSFDLTMFNKTEHYKFSFNDYDECLKTYLNMSKDNCYSNLSIIRQQYKLESCEVIK